MLKPVLALFGLMLSTSALADLDVPVYFMTNPHQGQTAGTVHISQTPYGLLFTADLHDLSPGIHGFHIHQNPTCEQAGMAAGGHLDPKNTNKHLGPYSDKGHLGDLPALYVSSDGKTSVPVVAPRLQSLKAIKNHALMLHEGGDNYSDTPAKLGGGGTRMLCGVIK